MSKDEHSHEFEPLHSDHGIAESFITALRKMMPISSKGFFTHAIDDALLGFGITRGTLLIVDPEVPYENGKIVLVVFEKKYHIRKIYFHDDRIELRPANAKYESIYVDRSRVEIKGVVIHMQKKL